MNAASLKLRLDVLLADRRNAMNPIHDSAARGYAKSVQAFVRGRPEYPEALVGWLRQGIGLAPGKVALDLGAGTGKLTKRLVATGARVIAVEPVPEMLAALSAALPQVEAHRASAAELPLPDRSVDAVVCAQAFHWFASAAALDEIHRVLKPGGWLGLIWNVQDERIDWVARLAVIISPYEAGVPRYRHGEWRHHFPHAGFGPLEELHFPHVHRGPAEEVIVERILSVSFIAALPREDHDRVAAELRALVASHPELRGKKEVTLPYVTTVFASRRND